MYLKKQYRDLMTEFDEEIDLPTKFYEYVGQIKKSHRLIIKSKEGYHCDNCDFQFIRGKSKQQYGEIYVKCPNCKKWLVSKTNRKQSYTQQDQFCVIEKFKSYFIYRLFDVKTEYENPGNYSSHCCEYGRKIFDPTYMDELEEVYNDNISATISGKYINHRYFLANNWRSNGSYYHSLGSSFMLYPYNLRRILKGTKYEYNQIWDFAKHVDYFNPAKYFGRKFEMIVKNKLYNLANSILQRYDDYLLKLDHKFICKNLSFIRRNGFNLDEIEFFQKTGTANARILKKYGAYNDRVNDISDVKIDFEKADKEIINLEENFVEYIDYLNMCRELQFDMKNKRILYPRKDIKEEHDRIEKLYDAYKNKTYDKQIINRAKKLQKNIYKSKKYIIFPVGNVEDLVDESSQQNNCVKTYAERIANGECDIYFMRLLSEQNKSLVTVEVRNNKVVQQRTKNNNDTEKEQKTFLKRWERRILNPSV